ncbi:MAG: hypothetical protein HY646_08645, partial [Acidobacteria bacterium]|nr:hypothetical protein [Acidobacteriota bacterium]
MTAAQIAALRGISLDTFRLLQRERSLTPEEICSMPQKMLLRALDKALHPKPDHPDEALRFRLMQMQDENGYIPPAGLIRAREHVRSMIAAEERRSPQAAGISRSSWSWIGPGNIGGRVRSIVIHPTTPATMFLGSVSGGIWKTTNAGASWQVVNDFITNLAVSTLLMDPTNPSVLYAGTGEGFYNADGIRGAGVFKSTDGGTTWSQLSSTANSSWYYVNRLAASPDGTVLLAATRSGIWRSTDGGITWSRVSTATDILDLEFNPVDGNYAIASGYAGRALYSTNGGATWSPASGIPTLSFFGRVEVAYAPSNPNIVYASVSQEGGEVWKSTDGGQSFSRVNVGNNFLASQGWYDNAVWVDPINPNIVIVGGIDLWRSLDGGATLTKISQWFMAPLSAHADQHFLIAHPSFNGTGNTTVFVGNDGGIYKTDNIYTVSGATGWQELNNNLGITQFYGAAGNTITNTIVGGTQDNGTLLYTGNSETWNEMFGGDGGWCAADPTDPSYLYGEYVYLYIHRSTNGGLTSSYIYSGITDAGKTANFIAPFILDPNNATTLLAGGRSLWRTADSKAPTPSWTAIKPSIGSNISSIAVAKGNSNMIWVGHNNGDVYMTTSGSSDAPSWTQVDTNSPGLPNRIVTRITMDPSDSNTVYLTFGGFSADNVYRSANAGTSWSDITGSGATGLPDVPIRSLVIHPTNTSWLYAGTEVGVFASENSGSTWFVPHDGPANVSVDELFWMGTTLVAATHGRGLFTTPTAASTPPSLTITLSKSTYSTGDTLTATEFRLRNPNTSPTQVKIRVWLKVPAVGDINLIDIGGDGNFYLPANVDSNLGPLSLITITSAFPPRG